MANGWGGPRPGSGRKPKNGAWREFCRKLALSPAVKKLIRTEAERDPAFALKVCEHAFGRPYQSLELKGEVQHTQNVVYVARFEDGDPLFTSGLPVPKETAH